MQPSRLGPAERTGKPPCDVQLNPVAKPGSRAHAFAHERSGRAAVSAARRGEELGDSTRDAPPIALLLPSLAGGGAERMTLNLARGLFEQGQPVDLLIAQFEGAYRDSVPKGVRLVDLGRKSMRAALWPLRAYLLRERPRVLIAAMNHTGVIAVWAARMAGGKTPVFTSVRSCLSVEAKSSPRLGDRLMPLLARLFFPWSRAVIAVSRGVADDLHHHGIDPRLIHVIGNPVVTPDLPVLAAESPAHSWLLDPETPVILGAGRLCTQKDFATLIMAFGQLKSTRPARLIILGEGPERPALERLVHDLGLAGYVALPGFEPNPFACMRAASLFVLSSAWEGLPGVLIQAMACGTPVIATDCPGGPREILDEGTRPLSPLVDVGDATALAAAMAATLDTPPSSERLERRAADFSMHVIAQRYLALIDHFT